MKPQPKSVLTIIAIISLVAAIVPFAIYICAFRGGLSSDQSIWGAFGDYLGGAVAPLFSLASFLGILYTVYMQREQLSFIKQDYNHKLEREEIDDRAKNVAFVLETIGRQLEEKQPYYRNHIRSLSAAGIDAYPDFVFIAQLLKQLQKFLKELDSIQPGSPLIRYYKARFEPMVIGLLPSAQVDEEIHRYFTEE